MSVLINDTTIASIKKKILAFLWDGKPPKIKYSTIRGDHSEGGIRLVDIESRIRALQIGWIKRSNQGQNWQNIFDSVNKIKWERAIRFNIDTKYIKGDFYKRLIISRQELFLMKPL